jgi:hypothetical protein
MNLFRRVYNRAKLTETFFKFKVLNQDREYRRWLKTGRRTPTPHIVKQNSIREFAQARRIQVLVETGTYLGEMVDAMKNVFTEIYSIELGEALARNARKRFATDKHITILQGNSSRVLRDILPGITRPTLFWLDAHYSGGVTATDATATPLEDELKCIFAHPLAREHVVLIDDARLLGSGAGYPTPEALQSLVRSSGFTTCDVKDDIVRIHT